MKNLILTLTFAFIQLGLFAQIGISGAYSSIKTQGWEELLSNEGSNLYNDGYTVGLEYWFRLKDYRIEFLPEISYGLFDNEIGGMPLVAPTLVSQMNILAFSFNTQIYILDIEGDCDCPTWGKEGGFFSKGFYLMAGPGVSLVNQSTEINSDLSNTSIDDETSVRLLLSLGAGLDIGITKAITVTAFGKFKWHSSSAYDGLEQLVDISPQQNNPENFDSVITQFEPGIKLSYRWGE